MSLNRSSLTRLAVVSFRVFDGRQRVDDEFSRPTFNVAATTT